MPLQKTLKESYLEELKTAVEQEVALELYSGDSFPLDPSRLNRYPGIEAPEALSQKLDPKDDFKSAVALYEAYRNLPPLIAAREPFWAYLTHTEMFHYTQIRWKDKKKESSLKDCILQHWFMKSGLFRNAAASLWWGIYLSADEQREDPYELSRILFSNHTLRIDTLGSSLIIRHKEAMIGILEFLKDNLEELGGLEEKGRYLSRHFNQLGAVKQLAALDRHFFRRRCEGLLPELLKVKSRSDLRQQG